VRDSECAALILVGVLVEGLVERLDVASISAPR
jgi:hypothetical protein